jgi:hypothetical protein
LRELSRSAKEKELKENRDKQIKIQEGVCSILTQLVKLENDFKAAIQSMMGPAQAK